MRVVDTSISEVKILEPRVFADERGYFMETWNARVFQEIGLELKFVQENQSRSSRGVLRGLHYQITNPQGKLVWVVQGEVLDVAVDLRRHSPTFGKHVSVLLSHENHRMLWIPPGFAHGFQVLSDTVDFLYKCTDFYAPQYERSLLWSDPQLGIKWHHDENYPPVLSAKDQMGLRLSEADTFP